MKELRKISADQVPKILSAVESFADDPRPAGCIKLSGTERSFRVRVGDYRVVYDIFDDIVLIEIVKVGHRKDVYRG